MWFPHSLQTGKQAPQNPVAFEERWVRTNRPREKIPNPPLQLGPGFSFQDRTDWKAEPSPEIQDKRIGMEDILEGGTLPAPIQKKNLLIERIFNHQLILKGCGYFWSRWKRCPRTSSTSSGAASPPAQVAQRALNAVEPGGFRLCSDFCAWCSHLGEQLLHSQFQSIEKQVR